MESMKDAARNFATLLTAALFGYAAAHLIHDLRDILADDGSKHHSRKSPPLPSPLDNYRNKVVLITGASRGIGAATAIRLAEFGVKLALQYSQHKEDADCVAKQCLEVNKACEVRLFKASFDSTPEKAAQNLLAEVIAAYGHIHVAVLNAGVYTEVPIIGASGPLHCGSKEEALGLSSFVAWWRRTMTINLDAPAYLAYLLGQHMARRRASDFIGRAVGSIVFVGSRGAYRGEPNAVAYGASKAGLHHLAQSLAVALGPHGVAVTAIAPGFVETPMAASVLSGPFGPAIRGQSPWGRVASPQEVAAAIAFLGAYWDCPWVTGTVLDCNGASYLH